MTFVTRLLAPLVAAGLLLAGCGGSDDDGGAATTSTTTTGTTEGPAEPSVDVELAGLFAEGALTSDAEVVDCTLENGSVTTCYRLTVASLPSTVDTDGGPGGPPAG